MSIVRQMSQLLLRGSLANVTMANLNKSQQEHIEKIIDKISKHPKMANHRSRFIRELGNTIGADYKDDRSAAEEEFQIAIWRGAVDLIYHNKYSFSCENCNNVSYTGKNGRKKDFDRQYPVCPACNHVKVSDPGDTSYQIGQFVDHIEFQKSYSEFKSHQLNPQCQTPILYHKINPRYEDPYNVLNDDEQLIKFFSEYLWNYFRQMLKENNRFEHNKKPKLVNGPGHEILLAELLALCSKMRIEHHFDKHDRHDEYFTVLISGLKTPPEFTGEFIELLYKAKTNGITIIVNDNNILIQKNINAPYIQAYISKPEHVLMCNNQSDSKDNDESQSYTISQISYKTIGAEKMIQRDDTAIIDNEDVINAIRHSLPDGECQQVFDIWAGRGNSFDEFSREYGDKIACINHIARYMGITTRAVNQHKETIKINMLAHGMTPE